MRGFHHLPDEELDEIVRGFISDHGRTTGQGYVGGYIKALGLRIQRKRLRESMARVDPQNTSLRWGVVVSRRTYQVPWPNSLWHLYGHHALIHWNIVVHGCIDGFSRRIIMSVRSDDGRHLGRQTRSRGLGERLPFQWREK